MQNNNFFIRMFVKISRYYYCNKPMANIVTMVTAPKMDAVNLAEPLVLLLHNESTSIPHSSVTSIDKM